MIDYLALGHLTADLQPDGSVRAGGTVLYAALAAQKLGLRPAIATVCPPEFAAEWLPADIAVHCQPAAAPTTFSNRYQGNRRTQHIGTVAPPLDLGALPQSWLAAPIIHLGPVAQEVPLPPPAGNLVAATPQGWLREWDTDGQVHLYPEWLGRLSLQGIGVLVLSEEDIAGDESLLAPLLGQLDTLVLTRAERGATVWHAGLRHDVPAFPATVVDPTGAGDVFATAFVIALAEGQPPVAAARWACAAAACAIEGPGSTTLPTRADIARRLA